MSNGVQAKNVSGNPFDIFVIGARKGFNIAINNLVPNILMAYAVAEILNLLSTYFCTALTSETFWSL